MAHSRGRAGKHVRGAGVVLASSLVLVAACGNLEVPEAAFGRTLPSPWLVTRSVETRGLTSPDRVVVRFSRERIERIDESGAVEIVRLDEPFAREGAGWGGKSSRLEMSAEEASRKPAYPLAPPPRTSRSIRASASGRSPRSARAARAR